MYSQHGSISRLHHCVNVSYLSFLLCRKWKLDARAAARAGLLHDLFFYERLERKMDNPIESHTFSHPLEAFHNAKELCSISSVEEDIIVNHMFPLCRSLPLFAETYVVSYIDKICAMAEALSFGWTLLQRFSSHCKQKVRTFLHA